MDRFDSITELQPQRGSAVPEGEAGKSESTLLEPASSSGEQSALRFQKQNPVAALRKESSSRPSDITITSTPYGSSSPQTKLDPAQPIQAGGGIPLSAGRRPSSPFAGTGSPSATFRSASPRHLSPATSQIFERDVQESTAMGPELSPAIPSHIQTEDHIPAVLEASSLAITDEQLNPDEVEIVMHSEHRPAAVAVAATALGDVSSPAPSAPQADLSVPGQDHEEMGSTYGAVDPTDPRRLSFISFADVVHAENVETGKESSHLMSPSSLLGSAGNGRSPSPSRSPLPERAPSSPLASGVTSFNASDSSPVRGGPGSTTSGQGHPHGELTIETMRQTLQRTGNNEPGIQPPTPV